MAVVCRKSGNECYGVKEMSLLFEISTLLNKNNRDLKDSLNPVMELFAKYLSADRVILTILNRTNSQIFIEVGFGLTDEEKNRATYKVGEGIIG
jgi:Nif-specific regulatory protein